MLYHRQNNNSINLIYGVMSQASKQSDRPRSGDQPKGTSTLQGTSKNRRSERRII